MRTDETNAQARSETDRQKRHFLLRRKTKVIIGAVIAVLVLSALIIIAVPWNRYDAESYFSQYEKHKVNGDVEQLLLQVKEFTREDVPLNDFSMYKDFPYRGYKYSIAFTAYGVANVAFIEPARRREMAFYLDRLIQRLEQYNVQQDWWTDGYSPNPDEVNNVMYRGHLNLMYGLYELIADDRKYEQKFKALTQRIVDESIANRNGRGEPIYGMMCETENFYIECNTISIYSIKLHDNLYGTDHSELINNWFNYITSQLRDKQSGLFSQVYHPTTDYPVPQVISYNNGWTITFLNAMYPDFAKSLYPVYKEKLIKEKFIWYAYAIFGGRVPEIRAPLTVNTLPHSDPPLRSFDQAPDPMGSLFAFFAASEMRDTRLFNKLLNTMSKVGVEKVDTHTPAGIVKVDVRHNFALQGPLLFGKTNIGLSKLLEFAEQKRNAGVAKR